jgi:predicted phage terminase large subunit-like protein
VTLAQDIAWCDRETGLTGSLWDYVKMIWPQVYAASPLQANWHMPMICEHLEACYRGEIKELVINIPPGGSKSSLACVAYPTWGWVRDPATRWIFGAYGPKIVRRDAYLSLDLMQSKFFKDRWGDLIHIPNVSAIEHIKNDEGGMRLGTTPGGEATGFHAHQQVIDDPIKPEELTKAALESSQEWLGRTLGSRWMRPPAVNALTLIMQRLHCNDLSRLLIDRGAVHLCLPANFDPARRTVTTWGSDPRTVVGELMDPVRLPQSFIDILNRNLGPLNASAQLQQNPIPEGGAVFRKDSIKYWTTLPKSFDQVLASWDCAFKDEETSDYVCGQVWGRLASQFYLIDQFHGHFNFSETVRRVVMLAAKYPQAVTKLIEDKANGTAVMCTLETTLPGIVAVDPKGGKFSRASACSGFFEAGNVFIPEPTMPGYQWVGELFLPEVLSFPRAKHDDQVDAMTQALLYFVENSNYLKAAMAQVRTMMGYVDLDN